jgi:hypothetical protein
MEVAIEPSIDVPSVVCLSLIFISIHEFHSVIPMSVLALDIFRQIVTFWPLLSPTRGQVFDVLSLFQIIMAMKIILYGANTVIGSKVLQHAVLHPKVTTVYCITKLALEVWPILNLDKVHNIVRGHLCTHDGEFMEQLRGSDGCIWYVTIISCEGRVLLI